MDGSVNAERSDRFNRIAGITVTTGSTFVTAFSASATNIALPRIAADFNLDAVHLSWVAMSYMLATAALVLPMGRIGDIAGRRRIFNAGLVIFTMGTVLCGIADNAWLLVAFRAVQGVGAAMQFATGMAILTSIFPPDKRGAALGINTASVYIGLSVGPVLGGLLTGSFGWRAVFAAPIPLAVVVLAVSMFVLKGEWKDAEGESFDPFGSVVYGLALICLLLGLSNITDLTGAVLIGAAAVLFVCLGFIETRVRHPILNLNLFRGNRPFTFSNIAALINYSATFGVGFLMSLYLQNVKGFTPGHAGAIMLTQPLVQAVFSPVTGKLSDTVEPTVLASIGMTLTAAGLLMLSFLAVDTSTAYLIGCLVTLGAGFALFSSPNTNAVMHSLQRRNFGVGGATLSTMRIVGQILSLGMATLIFAVMLGNVKIGAANQAGFITCVNITFKLFAAMCAVGIPFSLSRGRVLGDAGR